MTNDFDDIAFLAAAAKHEKNPKKQLSILKKLEVIVRSAIVVSTIRIKKDGSAT